MNRDGPWGRDIEGPLGIYKSAGSTNHLLTFVTSFDGDYLIVAVDN